MRTVFALCAILLLASVLAPGDPRETNLSESLAPPSMKHPLGTDLLGRDILVRLIHGGGRTVLSAGGATLLASGLGLLLGIAASELFGRMFDVIIDAMLAIPGLVTALVIMTLLGQGPANIVLAVGLAQSAAFARASRDALRNQRKQPYVESAVAIGANRWHILAHTLLPNAAPEILTFTSITFSWALLNGAGLAFLGFTGDPSAPDWGIMIAAGRQTFSAAPWEALSAGCALTLVVWLVNQAIQPRSK